MSMPYSDDPIKRFEYEARHVELQRQITQLSNDVASIAKNLSNSRVSVWQFIAITAINFTLSGGLLGFLAITGHFH